MSQANYDLVDAQDRHADRAAARCRADRARARRLRQQVFECVRAAGLIARVDVAKRSGRQPRLGHRHRPPN